MKFILKEILFRTRLLANLALFFSLGALLIMSLNVIDYPFEKSFLVVVYIVLAIFGQAYLFGLLIFTLMLVLSVSMPRVVFRVISAWFVGSIFFLLLIDSYLFNVYHYHLNIFFIKMFFTDIQGIGLGWTTVAFALVGLVGLVVIVYFASKHFERKLPIKKPLLLYVFFFGLTFLGQCIHAWGYAHNTKRILSLSHVIPVYYPLIANKEVKSWGLYRPDLVEESDGIKAGQASGFNYPRKAFTCTPETTPNIVFIAIESWRFDRLTAEVTPNIYDIGQNSLVFDNHLSTGSVTDRGLFGLFYGVSAAYIESALGAGSKPAIIDAVQQLNYEQWIIANQDIRSNKLDVLLFPDIEPIQESARGKVYEGDIGIVDQFIEQLNKPRTKPFFSFLLFNASHFSYWTPPNYPKPFEPSERFAPSKAKDDTERLPYFNQYSNSLHFLDGQVERVRQVLVEKGQWDNTIVVITGDHGEEFKDQNPAYWGHGSNFSRYQIGVPLVIHWPGREPFFANYRTSHEDITPTLVTEVLGCSVEISDVSTGKSLFDSSSRVNIVESYVNQAIVASDVVTELYPGFVKTYQIENISAEAKTPSAAIKGVQEVLGHFR